MWYYVPMSPERVNDVLSDIPEKLRKLPIIRPSLIVPTAHGFELDGLEFPPVTNTDIKNSEIGLENLEYLLEISCKQFYGLKPGVIEFDNNILRSMGIECNGQTGKICLSPEGTEYQFHNVTDGRTAIIFQSIVSNYAVVLCPINNFLVYPHIGVSTGCPVGFCLDDLEIPELLISSKLPFTDRSYQEGLTARAVEVAKKLGLKISSNDGLKFKNGLLDSVKVYPGDCCCCYLSESDGKYTSHNVDRANQAIALYWACGTFVRELADKLQHPHE